MVVFFDCETTGIGPDAQITCAATLDAAGGGARTWYTFQQAAMSKETGTELAQYLLASSVVVTFNGAAFDLRLLHKLTNVDALKELALHHVDIMYDFVASHRYYASMQSFAVATLGAGKSNTGDWAARAWFTDEWESVLEYCKQDVVVLQQLYVYAESHKCLKRTTKRGRTTVWNVPSFRFVSAACENIAPAPSWMLTEPLPMPDIDWASTHEERCEE